MAGPVITRCRPENLSLLAILDRECFDQALPADDLCSYLYEGTNDDSGLVLFENDRGSTETLVGLIVSEFSSSGKLEPIGFLLLVLRDELGVIERIGIRTKYRRRGMARKTLDYIRAASRSEGVTVWSAAVGKSDALALDFFRKIGFTNACTLNGELAKPTDDEKVILWRRAD